MQWSNVLLRVTKLNFGSSTRCKWAHEIQFKNPHIYPLDPVFFHTKSKLLMNFTAGALLDMYYVDILTTVWIFSLFRIFNTIHTSPQYPPVS